MYNGENITGRYWKVGVEMAAVLHGSSNGAASLRHDKPFPAQAVLDALAQQVAVLDSSGTIVAVNIAWNAFALANCGDPARLGIGHNYLQTCRTATGHDSDEASAALAGLQAVLEGRLPSFELNYPCHAPDRQRWFLMQATPINAPHGGAVVAHLDVTARHQAEDGLRRLNADLEQIVADQTGDLWRLNQRLLIDIARREAAEQTLQRMFLTVQEQAEALRRSNTDLQQFASLVAHELQEPLRMVSGFLELLQRRFGTQFDPEAQEFIEYALGGSRRMRQLIAGLLAFSRVDGPIYTPRTTDLNLVRDHVLAHDRLLLEEHQALVTSDPLPTVQADPLHMEIVLHNLLRNAVKFRSAAPVHVHISATHHAEGWTISVHDNGIGIAPKDHGRIFHMFERAQSHREHEGNGIGLAMCARIVARHGGRIWVESRPGAGATFLFTLPNMLPPSGT